MKRGIFVLFMVILSVCVGAQDKSYKILSLNTPSIEIGGRTCVKGSVFMYNEFIKWSSSKQSMYIVDAKDSNLKYKLFADAFISSKSNSISQYFYKRKASTRQSGFSKIIERDHMGVDSEKRIALVIGNSNYETEDNLYNPLTDALSVSDALSHIGFNVYVLYDATLKDMENAIKKFCNFSSDYNTALIYYAGHGIQFDNDVYLLPIDAKIETSNDVYEKSLGTKKIVSLLNEIETLQTRLLFVDACRTETNLLKIGKKDVNELYQKDELKNGIILFSTKYGNVAYDDLQNQDENSPFASSVIKNIMKPDVSVNDFITDVMADVKLKTAQLPFYEEQEPRPVVTLSHRFYFNSNYNIKYKEASSHIDRISQESLLKTVRENNSEIHDLSRDSPETYYELGLSYYRDSLYKEAVSAFMKADGYDYPAAQAMLGDCYFDGTGVQKDYYIAKRYYEKAAKKSYPRALYGMASMLYAGKGIKKNIRKAIQYDTQAAELGFADSQYRLGVNFLFGNYVACDEKKGEYWLDKLAENEEHEYKFIVGAIFRIYINWKESLEFYQNNKDNMLGDTRETTNIQVNLIKEHLYEKIYHLYYQAAKKGLPEAEYALGRCYDSGEGTKENKKEAEFWYTKSANQGYVEAQKSLAMFYYGDDAKRIYWYEKAAQQGDSWAKFMLGRAYQEGEGVEKDERKAATLFEEAATQGDECAIANIGICYFYGQGVEQDYKKAVMWFEKVAENGFYNINRVRKCLAECYEKGLGVKKNEQKAKYWYGKIEIYPDIEDLN